MVLFPFFFWAGVGNRSRALLIEKKNFIYDIYTETSSPVSGFCKPKLVYTLLNWRLHSFFKHEESLQTNVAIS